MRRYARIIGSIQCGERLDLWIVIQTEDHERAIAEGFEEIPCWKSDEQVKAEYGVKTIYTRHRRKLNQFA